MCFHCIATSWAGRFAWPWLKQRYCSLAVSLCTVMLALPSWNIFIAQHCTEPVTCFPSWTVMLALQQWHLFIAQHCTEPITYFPSWTVMLAFPQWHLFTAEYCTEPVTYFSLMKCHAGLSTVTLIYSWILHWTCNLLFPHELSCWPFRSDTYLQLNTALNM